MEKQSHWEACYAHSEELWVGQKSIGLDRGRLGLLVAVALVAGNYTVVVIGAWTVTERSVVKSKYKPQTFILSLPKGRGRTRTPAPSDLNLARGVVE